MKINFKIHTLLGQAPTDVTHAFVEFKEKYFVYNVRFHADEPKNPDDKSLGNENVLNIYEIVASKEKISGFQKSWLPSVKLFSVTIIVQSFENDIRIHFKRESKADEFFSVFSDWLYNPVFYEQNEKAEREII